jgi:opacity protein-like surface antigen
MFHGDRKLFKLMDASSFVVRVSALVEHIHWGTTNYKKKMTKTMKLVGALAALIVTGSMFAQTTTTSASNSASDLGSGVLGHRYADAGFQYTDVNHTPWDVWGLTGVVNNPVTPNIDVSLDYTYSWLKGWSANHDNAVDVNGIYYLNYGAFKPFAAASLGYEWTRTQRVWSNGESAAYVPESDNRATFGGRVGVEYQVTPQVSVQAQVQYSSDFKRENNSGSWDGDVTGRYWFTKQVAVYATVAWLEYGDWGYGAGVSYKF